MDETQPKILLARAAAATALTVAAGKASAHLDSLASWFLAAVGAGLAIAVSQIENVLNYVSAGELSFSAKLFLVATGLCVIQRFISTVVSSSASSAKELNDMMDERFEQMDLPEFVLQMTEAFPRFMRCLVTPLFGDIVRGDLAVTGRMLVRLSLYQALAVVLEMLLLALIIGRMAFNIGA
jgi:hypothetical protein